MQTKTESDRTSWLAIREFFAQQLLRILGPLLCLLIAPPALAKANVKSVLILYSFSDRNLYDPVESLESAVRARVPSAVNFYVEYMESQRFEDEAYRMSLAETLRRSYGAEKLDLVIAVSYPALQLATQYRDQMFPGVPIIFSDVNVQRLEGQKWPGTTGVTVLTDVGGTIDLALRLHPETNAVAVITDNSLFERYWMVAVHSELLRHRDKVTEIDIVGQASVNILEKVAALPPHTVVLFQLAPPQESRQLAFGVYDILAAVGQRRPTYCIWPRLCIDHGGVGGVYSDETEQSRLVAGMAERVLAGEKPENIPVQHGSRTEIRVVWRELRHWKIPESSLPPGTVVLYRQLTLWERDRKYIVAAIVLIVAQVLLITGLLWQRKRKRKAEAVLRESEKRFRVMADTTPSLVWMCDAQGQITYLNERRLAFTRRDSKAGYMDTWAANVHPDDLKNVLDTVSQALKTHQPFSTEYRLYRSDGAYRWMFDVASPRMNGDGSFGGFIGSAVDTTDQKLAQQALEKVSGQLIEAQEKERSRIARDLHDDICQRLALLSMELVQANDSSNGPPEAMKKRLEDIGRHCSEIAGDVQSLSHQLHSSRLDYLGVVAAIRGFCTELSKQHGLNIEFSESNVPTDLPKDVSLCLFRVTQEALHNAVKYSGVSQFAVELSGIEGAVQLAVSDAGAGFDVEEAKKNQGLGLVSMQERIHLVHGSFSVESKPWQGTRIIAVVPLVAQKEWPVEDGTPGILRL
jgi:PAS domain S-box-containing protein